MSNLNFESYPTLFRPTNNITQKPDTNNQQIPNKLDILPMVDMTYLDPDKLNTICSEWGIFRLTNHGIPINLLKAMQENVKKIFEIDYERKQGLTSNCPINYFWGTPALTQEGTALKRGVSSNDIDWMEGFNVPFKELYDFHPLIRDIPLINDFRNLLQEYSKYMTKIASTIYEAMIKSLNLDLQVAKTYLDISTGLVRVYRYPQHVSDDVKGLHVHTDSSILSILSEDQVGGLKFLKDDQWFDVQPIFGTLVVNLGDMMQVISDDKFKSVKHKVELNRQNERLSICYFIFPGDDTLINSSSYKAFSYNDFRARVQLDLKTFGHKIGLQSFKV